MKTPFLASLLIVTLGTDFRVRSECKRGKKNKPAGPD